jgi:hypothetical protein
MTGEEVVELANGLSQVIQQRGLRDAFAPASLFNRHNMRHRAAQDRVPQRRKSVAQKHLQRLRAGSVRMGEFTRLSAKAPIVQCDYAQF